MMETVETFIPPFVGFPSIPRLFRDVVITEKIDGTNASVHVLEDGRVIAASRTRYITPTDDNFGFAKWVAAHADELREGLGVGSHFGEWYGSGIQRGYGLLNGEKRFALFNTERWKETRPKCCEVVPVLYTGMFQSNVIALVIDALAESGSMVVPGFTKPEGIVIYHTHARHSFKYTFDKNDGHKGS